MDSYLRQINASGARVTNEQLMDYLRVALDQKYGQFVSRARHYWERHFAGKDPSDACVSVCISSTAAPFHQGSRVIATDQGLRALIVRESELSKPRFTTFPGRVS